MAGSEKGDRKECRQLYKSNRWQEGGKKKESRNKSEYISNNYIS